MPAPRSGEDEAAPNRESRWARRIPLLLLLLVALLMANGMWGATLGVYVRTPDPVIGRPNYDFFIFYVCLLYTSPSPRD